MMTNHAIALFLVELETALLTVTMLNFDISFNKNSVDPDQLASKKPADQDLLCFPLDIRIHAI